MPSCIRLDRAAGGVWLWALKRSSSPGTGGEASLEPVAEAATWTAGDCTEGDWAGAGLGSGGVPPVTPKWAKAADIIIATAVLMTSESGEDMVSNRTLTIPRRPESAAICPKPGQLANDTVADCDKTAKIMSPPRQFGHDHSV